MSNIPRHIVDEIKASTDLVQLVGLSVTLTRRGRNWVGRCPIHTDSKPSFEVIPHKSLWYCYPCGKGGDCFAFVREVHGMSFPDAVRYLGDRCGVRTDNEARAVVRQLPSPPPKPPPPPPPDVSPLWEACTPCPRHPFLVSRRYRPDPAIARWTPSHLPEWPEWWPRRSKWRLVTRGWDVSNRPANIHGRAVVPLPEDKAHIKALWAGSEKCPVPSVGLHFSNLLPVGDLLIVAEGLTDWLAGVEMFPGVAVYGATNGGFPSFAGLGIPEDTRIVSVTDADDAGDRYHRELTAALPGREILRANPNRLRPEKWAGKRYDLSDAWSHGYTANDLLHTCKRTPSTPRTARRWHDFFPGGIPGCPCCRRVAV